MKNSKVPINGIKIKSIKMRINKDVETIIFEGVLVENSKSEWSRLAHKNNQLFIVSESGFKIS